MLRSNRGVPMDEFLRLESIVNRPVQLPLVHIDVPVSIRELSAVPFPAPRGVEWR